MKLNNHKVLIQCITKQTPNMKEKNTDISSLFQSLLKQMKYS